MNENKGYFLDGIKNMFIIFLIRDVKRKEEEKTRLYPYKYNVVYVCVCISVHNIWYEPYGRDRNNDTIIYLYRCLNFKLYSSQLI